MSRPLTIDSDGHILEPPDMWERYLEPRYKDRAIRIRLDEKGLEYIEIDRRPSYMGGGVLGEMGGAYQDPVELMTPGKVTYWQSATRTPGAIDPGERVKQMDGEGIDIALLFPTIGICWESDCSDAEISAAYCRAYNNYLFDFCSPHPDRLIAIAHVNLCDVNLAVAEVERVKGKAKGIFCTPYPMNGRPYGHRYYDPFWAACEAANLPVSTHVQVRPNSLGHEFYPAGRAPWFFFMELTEDSIMSMNLVFQGGVLERFPRLRYVVLETGCAWLPAWMERADAKYQMFSFTTPMKQRPSRLFKEHCYISAEADDEDIALIAAKIGANRMMWATDYPHADAHPDPVASVRKCIARLSPEDQQWVLGRTAAEVWRL
jgi:predicted TIM-barrel fold metal-dependent hydrolase